MLNRFHLCDKINLFRYHGKYIQVTRTREQQSLDLHAGVPWENVVLTTFGTNKSIFTNILEEGKMQNNNLLYTYITIYFDYFVR